MLRCKMYNSRARIRVQIQIGKGTIAKNHSVLLKSLFHGNVCFFISTFMDMPNPEYMLMHNVVFI